MILKKILFYIFILNILYFFLAASIYITSSLLLINNKILNINILLDYQKNFYNQLGYRKIWQNEKNCVEFDDKLIFKPKIGKCLFANPEFNTVLNFDEEGRLKGNKLINKNGTEGVAVIGDSHAMGWGVNDNETFSAILEKKLNKKVYNLAVAGYATEREILRLKNSGLLKEINTVVIQYSDNDYNENISKVPDNNIEISKFKFNELISAKQTFFKRLRKAIRYSYIIPIEKLNYKNHILMNWNDHEKIFYKIINKYDFLKEKKIIVIYVNGENIKFNNFPNGQSKILENLFFLDISYQKKDFFILDGHLNKYGHIKVAKELYNNFFIK